MDTEYDPNEINTLAIKKLTDELTERLDVLAYPDSAQGTGGLIYSSIVIGQISILEATNRVMNELDNFKALNQPVSHEVLRDLFLQKMAQVIARVSDELVKKYADAA